VKTTERTSIKLREGLEDWEAGDPEVAGGQKAQQLSLRKMGEGAG